MKKLLLILLLLANIISFSQLKPVDVVMTFTGTTSYMQCQDYIVESSSGNWYFFYIDKNNSDFYYVKSTDKGKTWGAAVAVTANITGRSIAIWYDRWSGINGDLIHAAISESGSSRIMYRTVNAASSDALGTQRTAIDSTGTLGTGANLAMTITPNGYILVAAKWVSASGSVCKRSTDGGANWSSANLFFENDGDYGMLFPGFAADANDCIGIYWDVSAAEISKKLYDWSAGTWSETSIDGSLGTITYGGYITPFQAYWDGTNRYLSLVYWDGPNSLTGNDLLFWHITEESNAAQTNVLTDYISSATYPAHFSIALSYNSNTSTYYVYYAGDGSTEFAGGQKTYYKTSSNAGTSWGSAQTWFPYKLLIQGYGSLYSTTYSYPTPMIIQQSGCCILTTPVTIKKVNGVSPW